MHVNDLGVPKASFTKEEMQQGKYQEYKKKLHEQLLNTYNHSSSSRIANSHHNLKLLLPVFPVVKMYIGVAAPVWIVAVQIQTQVPQLVFRAVGLVVKNYDFRCNQA
jgi:hypothetical protein